MTDKEGGKGRGNEELADAGGITLATLAAVPTEPFPQRPVLPPAHAPRAWPHLEGKLPAQESVMGGLGSSFLTFSPCRGN